MSIEQEIRDLTVAINSLTYAILSKPVPAQADIKEIVEALTEVAEELPVKPIKKAKTVAFTAPEPTPMSDEEALAIVANEPVPVAPAPQTLSKDELQQQCLKLVRKDGALKPKLKSWLKDRGSDSLADLDEKHLADFQAFVDAVASEVK